MTIITNRESDRLLVRLPEGVRPRIKAYAQRNNQSMNQVVVATLEEKFPTRSLNDLVADAVGSDALVKLATSDNSDDQGALVASMNERLSEANLSVRFVVENEKVRLEAVGDR